jgi:AcrR family transcriptional regulator
MGQHNAINLRYTTQGDCVKLCVVSSIQPVERRFQRARTEANKKRRALDLVEAARGLALRDGARCVTLMAIAAHAGVHASAVRRYFDSREEILLVLTAQEWASWARKVTEALEGSQVVRVEQVASRLADSISGRPLFCDLLAHASLTLEREVPLEVARTFKLAALDAVESIGSTIARTVPELSEPEARDLVTVTTALAAMLWQYAHPPPALEQLYRDDPRLGHTIWDFRARLSRMIRYAAAGMTTPVSGSR